MEVTVLTTVDDPSHAVLDFAVSTEEVAQATTSPFCMLVVVNGYGLGT